MTRSERERPNGTSKQRWTSNGEDHRFNDVAEDLQILVVFAPPDTPDD